MTSAIGEFYSRGAVTDHITVEISLQIIGLFSEGLYSSPNKAIEELVSNAFDADATTVHVVMPADRGASGASIAVIDDGTGMDADGLKIHWIVGDSIKSRDGNRQTARGRRAIGKFGIGKLAAYVLGNRLTHFTKSGGKFYSTTMDFRLIPSRVDVEGVVKKDDGQSTSQEQVQLDLHELTEDEAKIALAPWMKGGTGRSGLAMFGDGAVASWTAAIISDLKPMATDLQIGRLRWVLSTAMPLRDDFHLFLNDTAVASSKLDAPRVGTWFLGREIQELPKPAPDDLPAETTDETQAPDYRHWRLIDSKLGPVSGYVEVFESPIDSGKAHDITGRNNGFFVYVHGRLINPDDAGFGIDRNSLRHGTFSRFRVVVNMDRLDRELRSSRESLRDGPLLERAQELLRATFNFARSQLEAFEGAESGKRQASDRVRESPLGLTERPIVRLAAEAFGSDFTARHLLLPDVRKFDSREAFLVELERLIAERGLFDDVIFEDLGTVEPMTILDLVNGKLRINLEHPFIAHFADEFGDKKKNLPLQLFAVSEILLEAELADAEIEREAANRVLDARDELLRELARSSGAKNSITVAQELLLSATSDRALEQNVVAAFRQLGFEAVPKGKKDESDGLAEAHLPFSEDHPTRYRVSLEAKSKQTVGAKVKKKDVEVSTIARHRDEADCDHAIVVGPDFETGADDLGAVMREIKDDRETHAGKTITLIRVSDLARLVRVSPLKRVNLATLRDLFIKASSPTEAAAWIEEIEKAEPAAAPYKAILETIWGEQEVSPDHAVTYSALRTALRYKHDLKMAEGELKQDCEALSRMASEYFTARDDRVELNTRPDKVLELVHAYVDKVPEEDS